MTSAGLFGVLADAFGDAKLHGLGTLMRGAAGGGLENIRVDLLVAGNHRLYGKVIRDATSTSLAVDLGNSGDRSDGFGNVIDEESGHPVGDHLAAGSQVHGDDRNAGGIGFGEYQAKPLRDRV